MLMKTYKYICINFPDWNYASNCRRSGRPIRMGAVWPIGPATILPLWWHGKSLPHFCNSYSAGKCTYFSFEIAFFSNINLGIENLRFPIIFLKNFIYMMLVSNFIIYCGYHHLIFQKKIIWPFGRKKYFG